MKTQLANSGIVGVCVCGGVRSNFGSSLWLKALLERPARAWRACLAALPRRDSHLAARMGLVSLPGTSVHASSAAVTAWRSAYWRRFAALRSTMAQLSLECCKTSSASLRVRALPAATWLMQLEVMLRDPIGRLPAVGAAHARTPGWADVGSATTALTCRWNLLRNFAPWPAGTTLWP